MKKKDIYPTLQYKLSPIIYHLLTPENFKELSFYMKKKEVYNLLVTPKNWVLEDKPEVWILDYLPKMSNYEFIKRLKIHSTKICDLSPIHVCKNLEVLLLANGDKTKIDYRNFPKLEEFFSWDRKGIKDIWKVLTLKKLALYGLKKHQFSDGLALDSIEELRIANTAVSNLDILRRCKKLKYLELIGMSKLEDFSFLKDLPQLTYLNIKANKLKEFSIVSDLINLKSCFIESKIGEATVGDFQKLKKLKNFSLKGNDNLLSIRQIIKHNIDNS